MCTLVICHVLVYETVHWICVLFYIWSWGLGDYRKVDEMNLIRIGGVSQTELMNMKGKGKVFPLQARCGPECG